MKIRGDNVVLFYVCKFDDIYRRFFVWVCRTDGSKDALHRVLAANKFDAFFFNLF